MNKFIHIGPIAAERITGMKVTKNQWPSWIISESSQKELRNQAFLISVKGRTKYGFEFATTPSGLLFIMPDDLLGTAVEDCGGEEKAYSVNLSPYWLPTADWLYAFHRQCSLCPLGTELTSALLNKSMA